MLSQKEWLNVEVSKLLPLLDNVSAFDAFGAALGVARSF